MIGVVMVTVNHLLVGSTPTHGANFNYERYMMEEIKEIKEIKCIILEDMFEGTVEQFADCFFSNVDEYTIELFADQMGVKFKIFY